MNSKLKIALIALAVSMWPEVYDWIRKGIDWLLSQGKWGLIVIAALAVEGVISDLF